MGDNRELEATRDFDPGADDSIFDAAPDLVVASLLQFPEQIGRYQIKGVLGKGGFGLVYLAHDGLLGRAVAVKVPHRKLVDRPEYAEAYLNEARIVASLDHPHIVPVYDFGCTEQLPCFIVSKYIDGMDLASRLRQSRLTIKEATELTVVVAEALHHAHKQGLVHRDVKPGNILLDKQGKPYVSDFGLALREGQFEPDRDRLYGTPHYMSPEQARGEGHLVDGRADVFTLGVVIYEILTGIRPFSGPTLRDVLEAVVSHEPRPLRQRNELIPRELQRIVMQAMSKRASERYSSAQDFADDLRDFLKSDIAAIVPETLSTISTSQASPAQPTPESHTGNSASTSLVIVPKGLQAFDASDRDFFLGLVPGPHDREGLPQSLKFWKTRIEAVSHPLRVGVVYGPSGCGKSSLIRAGLLPKLAASVREVVITTTAKLTEKRLLDELKPLFQQPPGNLVDALQRLRRNASMGRRILIVFDQFEQWLHANHASADSELVQALRQCDGEHVACLLIVRDDFWMSVHRFFRELDIRLAERENCAAVDLFDMRHARRVLHAFGHAYGHLPERTEQLSADQHQFLDQVIAELAEDDHVICVRLALFSQMIRNRSWIPETLTAIGGARGVGIRFLEDTFGPTSAPLAYRAHQVAICEMLRALLPPPGTDIKACTRTVNELVRVAEYDVHSEDFRQVLEILEHETRLLTPVDSPQPTTDATSFNVTDDSGGYQLTHDYLVPSIREWLTRKQRESWRGRCELRLSERASLWNSRRERKQLPSLSETVQITLGTSSTNWTVPQAQMMRQAQRWHGQRALVFLLILTCLSIGAAVWNHGATLALRQHSADAIVDQLLVADIGNVTPVLREMDSTRDLWTARLRLMADQVDELPDNRLRAELALVSRDRERLGGLLKRVLEADSETVRVVREWLATEARPTLDDLSKLIETSTQSNPARLRIAALLAEFAPQSEELWREITGPVATTLVADFSLDTNSWADLLMPVRARLEPELASHFRNAMLTSTQRLNAAQLLAKMGSTELLCRLVPDADTTQFSQLMRPLSRDREPAIK
ncbi:MAG: serine/threonine protein kinase, partial [Planctomycetaceae bacterium]|nr:serine/threonine protein kinase [Planctomycetaceae bacterium]